MRTLKSQAHWVVALFSGFCLVAAAITVADRPELPAPVSATDAHELSTVFRGVAKKALPSVVTIETRQKAQQISTPGNDAFEKFFESDPRLREFFKQMPRQRRMPQRSGMGSGFVVDPSGIIVTNNHVVQNADEIVVRLHDGREYEGYEVQTDPRTDLAILRIDAEEPCGRQPVRARTDRHFGNHFRERSRTGHCRAGRLPADRRRHQSGKQRRTAAEPQRRRRGCQHGDLFPHGRIGRNRLRRSGTNGLVGRQTAHRGRRSQASVHRRDDSAGDERSG